LATKHDRVENGNLFWRLGNRPQPFSPASVGKHSRLRGATSVDGICPYCAVGCAQQIWVKEGKFIDIEGDPRSPINEGTLCPKGSDTFQYVVNPHRITSVLYRAPFATEWEEKPLDWAMEQIARRVKETRDADYVDRDENGKIVNHTIAMAHLGGATLDNEENYVIKKLFNNLGIISVENQARI